MSTKPPARFTFLLDPDLKKQFEEECAARDITPSQQMRQMIKAYLTGQAAVPARATPAKPSRRAARR